MSFEWDEEKNKINIAKHGIDFVDAKEIWQEQVLEFASPQDHHSEESMVAIGLCEKRYIAVIYT